jgi:predicted ABC-type ATPase
MKKNLEIIAGANGSGKSTFWKLIRRLPEYQDVSYMNANTIAEGLGSAASLIKAGKVMLHGIYGSFKTGKLFVFETTLAGQNWQRLLSTARQEGYSVTIHYLFLLKIETAIERVAFRVQNGGHQIPEETVRRQYDRFRKFFYSNTNVSLIDSFYITMKETTQI